MLSRSTQAGPLGGGAADGLGWGRLDHGARQRQDRPCLLTSSLHRRRSTTPIGCEGGACAPRSEALLPAGCTLATRWIGLRPIGAEPPTIVAPFSMPF
eukprot:3367296-Prymnesium_polylepis.1